MKRLIAYDADTEKYLNENPDNIRYEKLKKLSYAYSQGFTLNQIKILAKSELSAKQLSMLVSLPPYDLTEEQLKFVANPEFDAFQIYELATGFIEGLSMEQVKLYAQPRFESYRMHEMKQKLKNGEDIDYMLKSAKRLIYKKR